MSHVEALVATMVGLTIESVAATPDDSSPDNEFIELDVWFTDGTRCNICVTDDGGAAVVWMTP